MSRPCTIRSLVLQSLIMEVPAEGGIARAVYGELHAAGPRGRRRPCPPASEPSGPLKPHTPLIASLALLLLRARRRPCVSCKATRNFRRALALAPILVASQERTARAFDSLSWLPMDAAPKGELELADAWSVDFVVYLARILLNYDEASSAWWQAEVVPTVEATLDKSAPEPLRRAKRAAKLREVFADYTASVELGLRRYQDQGRSPSNLLRRLADRYGSTEEQRRQLALCFCLLEDQPRELLSELLSSLGLETLGRSCNESRTIPVLSLEPSRP